MQNKYNEQYINQYLPEYMHVTNNYWLNMNKYAQVGYFLEWESFSLSESNFLTRGFSLTHLPTVLPILVNLTHTQHVQFIELNFMTGSWKIIFSSVFTMERFPFTTVFLVCHYDYMTRMGT